jgi:hypothetical protein
MSALVDDLLSEIHVVLQIVLLLGILGKKALARKGRDEGTDNDIRECRVQISKETSVLYAK